MSAGFGVWGIWKWDVNPSGFFIGTQDGYRQYPGKEIINLESYSKKKFFSSQLSFIPSGYFKENESVGC